jgi:hypothetical protein
MNEITTHDFGLLRREVKDLRGLVSNLYHRILKLVEPSARPRPAGLTARLAATALMARVGKRAVADVARQHYGDDRELAA